MRYAGILVLLIIGLASAASTSPTQWQVETWELPNMWRIAIYDRYAYVWGESQTHYTDPGRLFVVDVTTGEVLNQINLWDAALWMIVHNGYMYVTWSELGVGGGGYSYLSVYDLSDPLTPRELFRSQQIVAGRLEVVDTYLYAIAAKQVWIFDIANPTNPTELWTQQFDDFIRGYTLQGLILYLTWQEGVTVVRPPLTASMWESRLPLVLRL
jgi:hypothetical protein